MKRILLSGFTGYIVSLILLTNSVNVVSQTQESVTVYLSVNIEEGLESYRMTILDVVLENLEREGVDPQIGTESPNVQISIHTNQIENSDANQVIFTMQAFTPVVLPFSPILYTQADYPFEFFLESPNLNLDPLYVQNNYINWLTGIAFYSINRCDLAMPYLSIDTHWTYEVNTYIDFYAGNCGLMLGDFELAARHFYSGWFLVSGGGIYTTNSTINLGWTLLQRKENELWELSEIMEVDHVDDWPIRLVTCLQIGEISCDLVRGVDQYTRIGQLYALDFDYDTAIEYATRAINITERNMRRAVRVDAEISGIFSRREVAELYVLRGQMVMLLYEWDRVLADYNTAIELDPTYADAYFYRGVLYYSVLERESALADFEYYLELVADDPSADHSEEATRYADSIRTELESLGDD